MTAELDSVSLSDGEENPDMPEEEFVRHKRIKKLAKSLNITYDQAKDIDNMTTSKGIQHNIDSKA